MTTPEEIQSQYDPTFKIESPGVQADFEAFAEAAQSRLSQSYPAGQKPDVSRFLPADLQKYCRDWYNDPSWDLLPLDYDADGHTDALTFPKGYRQYEPHLAEWEKACKVYWDHLEQQRELNKRAKYKLNHYYHVDLEDMNWLVDHQFGIEIANALVVPESVDVDYGKTSVTVMQHNIVYTVCITHDWNTPVLPDIDSPELREIEC